MVSPTANATLILRLELAQIGLYYYSTANKRISNTMSDHLCKCTLSSDVQIDSSHNSNASDYQGQKCGYGLGDQLWRVVCVPVHTSKRSNHGLLLDGKLLVRSLNDKTHWILISW